MGFVIVGDNMSKKRDWQKQIYINLAIVGGIIGGLFALLVWWLLAFIVDMFVRFLVWIQNSEDVRINPLALAFALIIYFIAGILAKWYWDRDN